MDALNFVVLVLGFTGWGIAGFTAGRIQRQFRWRREVRNNLALANANAHRRSIAVRHAVTLANTDDDDDSARRLQTGRGTIPRPDYRTGPRTYASRRDPGFLDAQTVTSVRAPDFGYDC